MLSISETNNNINEKSVNDNNLLTPPLSPENFVQIVEGNNEFSHI